MFPRPSYDTQWGGGILLTFRVGFTEQEADWLFSAPAREVALAALIIWGLCTLCPEDTVNLSKSWSWRSVMGVHSVFFNQKEHLLKGIWEIAPQLCGCATTPFIGKPSFFEGFPTTFSLYLGQGPSKQIGCPLSEDPMGWRLHRTRPKLHHWHSATYLRVFSANNFCNLHDHSNSTLVRKNIFASVSTNH